MIQLNFLGENKVMKNPSYCASLVLPKVNVTIFFSPEPLCFLS